MLSIELRENHIVPTDTVNQRKSEFTLAKSAPPDPTLAAAIEPARLAVLEVAGASAVGSHRWVTGESELMASQVFECLTPGYADWNWWVTVVRAPESEQVTVSEVNLLPGSGALLPPSWVPWSDRIEAGDLHPGDVLPRRLDDPLLAEAYAATDEDADQLDFWELGLGRTRVLSLSGRDLAAQRWYEGEHGPTDPHAEFASAPCGSCGYFLPMAGGMRQLFGVCANEWSPTDGRVVSLDHGCGAHSEAAAPIRPEVTDQPVVDELGYENLAEPALDEVEPASAEPTSVESEPAAAESEVAEPALDEAEPASAERETELVEFETAATKSEPEPAAPELELKAPQPDA